MKLKNVNPLGAVSLYLIGRVGDNGVYGEPDDRGYAKRTPTPGSGCLEAGEVFEVDDKTGRALLEQVGNYEQVGAPPKRKPKKAAAVKTAPVTAAVVAEKAGK